MNYAHILLTGLCLAVIAGGCGDHGADPDPVDPSKISFQAFAVGQKSAYVRFTASSKMIADAYGVYHYVDDTLMYQPDTLIAEIVSTQSNGFDVVEYYSTGSRLLADPELGAEAARRLRCTATIRNDSISFSGESRLVHHLLAGRTTYRALPLADIREPEMYFIAWRASLYPGETNVQGCVSGHVQCGRRYSSLNIVIDNAPMAWDGDGSTHVYSRRHGIVRVIVQYSWGMGIGGWDLL